MATKSLIINSTSQTGKKLQKSITNVNPNVSNEDAGTFAQMANALTTNVYQSAGIVKKMDVTEEDSGGGSTPTVTLLVAEVNNSELMYSTIEGGVRVYDDSRQMSWLNITYTVG